MLVAEPSGGSEPKRDARRSKPMMTIATTTRPMNIFTNFLSHAPHRREKLMAEEQLTIGLFETHA
jgi:hypothetical protein